MQHLVHFSIVIILEFFHQTFLDSNAACTGYFLCLPGQLMEFPKLPSSLSVKLNNISVWYAALFLC